MPGQALLPGAVGQSQQEEEEAGQDEDGPRHAHAGHGPGQLVVQGDGVIAGQQRQHGLVEHQDGEKDQDTWGRGGRRHGRIKDGGKGGWEEGGNRETERGEIEVRHPCKVQTQTSHWFPHGFCLSLITT